MYSKDGMYQKMSKTKKGVLQFKSFNKKNGEIQMVFEIEIVFESKIVLCGTTFI